MENKILWSFMYSRRILTCSIGKKVEEEVKNQGLLLIENNGS